MFCSLSRICWSLLASCLAAGAVPAAVETDSLRESIAACAGLDDDTLRLGCFDALAAMATSEAPRPAPDTVRRYPVEGEPAVPVAPAPPPAPPPATSPTAPPAAPAATSNADLFGMEDRATEDIDKIESRFAGHFEGWSGHTLFPLENGQVWRQTENDKLAWTADNPLVTIKKGVFGSFRLSVEGVNKTVRVERIN